VISFVTFVVKFFTTQEHEGRTKSHKEFL
jgi:hypothetical protein